MCGSFVEPKQMPMQWCFDFYFAPNKEKIWPQYIGMGENVPNRFIFDLVCSRYGSYMGEGGGVSKSEQSAHKNLRL
jgi:hypothetical protein